MPNKKVSDRAVIRDRHRPIIEELMELGAEDTSEVVARILDEYGQCEIDAIRDRRRSRSMVNQVPIQQANPSRPIPIPETSPQDLGNFSYVEASSSDLDEPIKF
jgi:hypothetical protein